jgi:hypothetical protein
MRMPAINDTSEVIRLRFIFLFIAIPLIV